MEKSKSESGIDPKSGKPFKRSTGKWGWNTIFGRNGSSEPYMTRVWIGRLRLHIFHHGDTDADPHDHPWPFWTFPLTSYVEEVTVNDGNFIDGSPMRYTQIVRAFRLNHRPATHCHRVIGGYSGYVCDPFGHCISVSARDAAELPQRFEPMTDGRKIITIVWRGKEQRQWGFLKNRDGKWCWQVWKEYILAGGPDSPCQ